MGSPSVRVPGSERTSASGEHLSVASQRASDRAVYELLARSPELQGRLEAFLRDHPDQMPARQRQVLMRSVEKAARDPRVGLALRDEEGDCEWWSEPVETISRGPFAVPVARGAFDLEADCRRGNAQAAPVPVPTGWRCLPGMLWSICALLAATLGTAARDFWRAHITSARMGRRAGRSGWRQSLNASGDLPHYLGCAGLMRDHLFLRLHTASRGPPSAALLRTLACWPAVRVCTWPECEGNLRPSEADL